MDLTTYPSMQLIDLNLDEILPFLYQIIYIVSITVYTFKYILGAVVLTRLLHLICDILCPKWTSVKDLATCLMGVITLYRHFSNIGLVWNKDGNFRLVLYTVVQLFICLLPIIHQKSIVKHLINRRKTLYSTCNFVMSISPIIVNEFLIYYSDNSSLPKLRGLLMTLAMKCISQSQESDRAGGGWLRHLAYYIHPASCILGPWHPFSDVPTTGNKKQTRLTAVTGYETHTIIEFRSQLIRSSIILVKAMAFLTLNTVVGELKSIYETNYHLILISFFTALEFRTSHYFICHLGSSFLSLWTHNEVAVCNPCQVEWPNSLLQVVVSWNLMMSKWLKIHIFRPSLKKTGKPYLALFATYLTSTLLHGVKPHIAAVLLSFCFLTYAEHVFRRKISNRYDACVDCTKCQYTINFKCILGHSYTIHNSKLVKLFNLLMTLLAATHLAYLGSIFEGDTDLGSYKDVYAQWSQTYHYSHLIGLAMCLCTLF